MEVQCQERGFCVSSGRPELSTGTTRSSMLGRVSFSCGDKGDSGGELQGLKLQKYDVLRGRHQLDKKVCLQNSSIFPLNFPIELQRCL